MVTLSNYSLVPKLCKGSFAFFQAYYFSTQRIEFQIKCRSSWESSLTLPKLMPTDLVCLTGKKLEVEGNHFILKMNKKGWPKISTAIVSKNSVTKLTKSSTSTMWMTAASSVTKKLVAF